MLSLGRVMGTFASDICCENTVRRSVLNSYFVLQCNGYFFTGTFRHLKYEQKKKKLSNICLLFQDLCTDSGLFSGSEENAVNKTLANPMFIYT